MNDVKNRWEGGGDGERSPNDPQAHVTVVQNFCEAENLPLVVQDECMRDEIRMGQGPPFPLYTHLSRWGVGSSVM